MKNHVVTALAVGVGLFPVVASAQYHEYGPRLHQRHEHVEIQPHGDHDHVRIRRHHGDHDHVRERIIEHRRYHHHDDD
ncbi:hypothetical protein GMJLKIPL_0645 [Methylobacterium isbiliense]|uniref:Uncharacterized protein n=1 Tax=Methylobacterium isbiliense TaxID=315478 RepID=A0ABQ4S8D0_9HYPH|nr:hypothetical protein GMJLKIPL_0645 [Methylobacterium isbiliense]